MVRSDIVCSQILMLNIEVYNFRYQPLSTITNRGHDGFISVIQPTMPELKARHKQIKASYWRLFGPKVRGDIRLIVQFAIDHLETVMEWLKAVRSTSPPLIVEHMKELEEQRPAQAKIICRAFDSWS